MIDRKQKRFYCPSWMPVADTDAGRSKQQKKYKSCLHVEVGKFQVQKSWRERNLKKERDEIRRKYYFLWAKLLGD